MKMMRKQAGKRGTALLLGLILLLSACGTGKMVQTTASETFPETQTAAVQPPVSATAAEATETTKEAVRPFFGTADLDGNPLYLSEICAAHKLTLVNYWASWCPPCIRELPELEKIWQKYRDSGLAVVGVLLDAMDGGLKEGKALLKQAGVSYLNVMPSGALVNIVVSQYVPVTCFLNEKGEKIGETIIGADPAAYEEQIRLLMP